jgi:hypothetical protein
MMCMLKESGEGSMHALANSRSSVGHADHEPLIKPRASVMFTVYIRQ